MRSSECVGNGYLKASCETCSRIVGKILTRSEESASQADPKRLPAALYSGVGLLLNRTGTYGLRGYYRVTSTIGAMTIHGETKVSHIVYCDTCNLLKGGNGGSV